MGIAGGGGDRGTPAGNWEERANGESGDRSQETPICGAGAAQPGSPEWVLFDPHRTEEPAPSHRGSATKKENAMNAKKLARIGAIAGAMTVGGLTFGLLNPLVPASAQDTTAPTVQSATPDGNRPEHGDRRMGAKPSSAAVAAVLGMTEEEVHTARHEGKTLAVLASEKGVDVQKVIDAMVADASTRLDQAVTDGKLTQAEADAKKAELPAKMTERVNSTPPAGGRGPGGPGGHRGDRDATPPAEAGSTPTTPA